MAGIVAVVHLIYFFATYQTVKERFISESMERNPAITYISSAECAYEKVIADHGEKAIENYLDYREQKKKGKIIKIDDETFAPAFKTLLIFGECSSNEMIAKYTRQALEHIHPFSKPSCNIFLRKEAAPDVFSIRCRFTNLINQPVVVKKGDIIIKSKVDQKKIIIHLIEGIKIVPKGTFDGWIRLKIIPEFKESLGIEKNYAQHTDINLHIREIFLKDNTVYRYE